jgi:nitronate monooxygenase
VAAVLKRGAQGAVLGTAFLATHESFAHDYHKQRIVDSREGQTVHTQAFHINWPEGAYVRVLESSVTRGQRGDPFVPERVTIGQEKSRPIYLFSTDSPLRDMTGDYEAMALYAGKGSAAINDIVPAAERLKRIVREAEDAL